MALTNQAHVIIREHFIKTNSEMNLAVDATCGNGYDTLFLSTLGFNKVVGFDIQKSAIKATEQRLRKADIINAQLIQIGHQHIEEHIENDIDCAMFNLGYLPSADKCITTNADTTLLALESCLKLLSSNGIISILCYPGHPEGKIETEAIQIYLRSLSDGWVINNINSELPSTKTPKLFIITQDSN